MNILLIEDERDVASFVKNILEEEQFHVTACESVEEALENHLEEQHDLIILDLMLGGKSGDYLIKQLRGSNYNIPILTVSALSNISKKVEILNMGADDYLTKPFDAEELIARVKALYRRSLDMKSGEKIAYYDFEFYRKENRVVRAGKEIFLTRKEGDVLNLLLHHRGQTVRLEDILLKVWQAKQGYHSNIVQATIRRLRKKIDSGYDKKLIKNIHGIGYMIAGPEETEV